MLISNIFMAALTFFLMLAWFTNLIVEYIPSNATPFSVSVILSSATFFKNYRYYFAYINK